MSVMIWCWAVGLAGLVMSSVYVWRFRKSLPECRARTYLTWVLRLHVLAYAWQLAMGIGILMLRIRGVL